MVTNDRNEEFSSADYDLINWISGRRQNSSKSSKPNRDITYDTLAQMLNKSHFNENEVLWALKKVKPKKTTGSDDIPAFILKDCAYPLSFL